MTSRHKAVRATLLVALAAGAASACSGSDGVASPGEGSFVISPPPAPPVSPPTSPPVSPPTSPTAPSDCPTGFTNVGLVSLNNASLGSAGSYRNCQLPSAITGSLLIPQVDGTVYSLSGRVDVGEDLGADPAAPIAGRTAGILSIEPGVTVFGTGTADFLVVNRGSQINAVGNASAPIVFTSRQSVEGSTNVDSIGQWGGVVLLGRAPTADGCPTGVTAPDISCEAIVEGTSALYGGNTISDSSGRLSFVRVQHSGFEVLPGNELNGITLAGLGNGTVIDHVQVHNSSDDGIEIFGGTVNLSNIVLTGNDDDSYDLDSGWRGGTQYLLAVQRPNGGDRVFETSSRGAKGTPTGTPPVFPFNSQPRIANATLVGRSSSSAVIIANSGNGIRVVNSVMTKAGGTGACLDIDDADTTTAAPTFNSVFMSCPVAFQADGNQEAETASLFNAGSNNVSAGTSTLTSIVAGASAFVNGGNENGMTVTTPINTSTYSTTFTNTTYVGAVQSDADTWYRGWTCSALIGEEDC
ncbi:MAG: hypothetical protein R3C52_00125 [Hyphomonadaceae bacterium]